MRGKVKKSDKYGKCELAYPIYCLSEFTGCPNKHVIFVTT